MGHGELSRIEAKQGSFAALLEPAPLVVFNDGTGEYPLKRAASLTFAVILLVLLAPALLAIGLIIRITSKGSALHWSRRVGRHGRLFWMPKFRTMQEHAPVQPREGLVNAFSHITPLGRFLRRWCVDEVPQLLCIVRGDMCFVGPRPLLASDPATRARETFHHALQARPGLTGLAQVRGRNSVSPRRKARLDALYVKRISMLLDLNIMFRTAVILLTGRGYL